MKMIRWIIIALYIMGTFASKRKSDLSDLEPRSQSLKTDENLGQSDGQNGQIQEDDSSRQNILNDTYESQPEPVHQNPFQKLNAPRKPIPKLSRYRMEHFIDYLKAKAKEDETQTIIWYDQENIVKIFPSLLENINTGDLITTVYYFKPNPNRSYLIEFLEANQYVHGEEFQVMNSLDGIKPIEEDETNDDVEEKYQIFLQNAFGHYTEYTTPNKETIIADLRSSFQEIGSELADDIYENFLKGKDLKSTKVSRINTTLAFYNIFDESIVNTFAANFQKVDIIIENQVQNYSPELFPKNTNAIKISGDQKVIDHFFAQANMQHITALNELKVIYRAGVRLPVFDLTQTQKNSDAKEMDDIPVHTDITPSFPAKINSFHLETPHFVLDKIVGNYLTVLSFNPSIKHLYYNNCDDDPTILPLIVQSFSFVKNLETITLINISPDWISEDLSKFGTLNTPESKVNISFELSDDTDPNFVYIADEDAKIDLEHQLIQEQDALFIKRKWFTIEYKWDENSKQVQAGEKFLLFLAKFSTQHRIKDIKMYPPKSKED